VITLIKSARTFKDKSTLKLKMRKRNNKFLKIKTFNKEFTLKLPKVKRVQITLKEREMLKMQARLKF
jgi:hypothetical protein